MRPQRMNLGNDGHIRPGELSLQCGSETGQPAAHYYDVVMNAHTKILGKKAKIDATKTNKNRTTPIQNKAL